MPVLTEEIKSFIVKGLACYDTPSQVAKAVGERFELKIDRFQVYAYDPEGTKRPAKKWVELYEATRAAFLEKQGSIAVAQRAARLRRLDRMADRAEATGNLKLAAELLEQAAKECGDAFTNKLKLTGADGGAIKQVITVAQVEQDLDDIFGRSNGNPEPGVSAGDES